MTINLLTVVEILLVLDLFRCIPSFESGTLETGWNGYILIVQPEKVPFFPHIFYINFSDVIKSIPKRWL